MSRHNDLGKVTENLENKHIGLSFSNIIFSRLITNSQIKIKARPTLF